jgi:hypothetical protein
MVGYYFLNCATILQLCVISSSLNQTYLHWLLIVAKELLIDLYDVACCR